MSDAKTLTVVVGSKKKAKIEGVVRAMRVLRPKDRFVGLGIDVASGQDELPIGETACILGAQARALECKKLRGDGDIFVGVESGIRTSEFDTVLMSTYAWVIAGSQQSFGISGAHILQRGPRLIAQSDYPTGRQSISERTRGRYTLEDKVAEAVTNAMAAIGFVDL